MTRIAVIGLGEAGSLYAGGFRGAGARVRGYDLRPRLADGGQVDRLADAIEGAEIVVSLVGAAASLEVADEALPLLEPSAIFADFNTSSPDLKHRIAAIGAARDVDVVDVAVLAPVPREAERTPLLASGHGAERLAELLRPLGAPVVVLDQPAGAAARMKLLRSVFTKGLATLMIETLGAARAAGAEDWVRGQIASELGDQGPALLDRFVAGTYQHAERREHEVRDVLAALEETEQPSDMTRGTLAWFQRILAERPA